MAAVNRRLGENAQAVTGAVFIAALPPEDDDELDPSGVKSREDSSLPTTDDITLELWKIATGEGSEASRVSALRTLADIMGLLKPQQQELPEAMTWLLDALARGLGEGSS